MQQVQAGQRGHGLVAPLLGLAIFENVLRGPSLFILGVSSSTYQKTRVYLVGLLTNLRGQRPTASLPLLVSAGSTRLHGTQGATGAGFRIQAAAYYPLRSLVNP